MLIRPFIALFFLAGILACKSSRDTKPSVKGPDSMQVRYLVGQPDVFSFNLFAAITTTPVFGPGGPTITTFEYTGDKIIRRNGGFIPVMFSGGVTYKYTLEVFDKVEYFKDSIILTLGEMMPDIEMMPAKRKLILEKGRLKTKIYYNTRNDGRNDTIQLSYGADGKVSRMETVRSGRLEIGAFHYSAAGNLQKITSVSYVRDSPGVQLGEGVTTFEGYDGAANPLKNLWLWDDIFYRTLSNNNFTKYTTVWRNSGGAGQSSSMQSWTLKYDSMGRVLFDQ